MSKMWTIKNNIVEKDLSYALVGIFFSIHKELGPFARERQYGDALEIELRKNHFVYQRELPVLVAARFSNRIDFLIDEKVIIDIKAKPFTTREDYYQMNRYLHSTKLKLGIIVNFREKYLRPRRILNPSLR